MEYFVIDEFAALRIVFQTRKEFAEINDSLRRIILMGRERLTFILSWHCKGQRHLY